MKKTERDWPSTISDIVLIVSALLAVAITLLHFIGLLDQVKWLNARLPTITLLAISFVMFATVIDRHTKLARIERLLQQSMDTYVLGVQYLKDSSSVIAELQDMVRKAEEFIMALGAKSTATPYLQQITDRASSGEIIYYRLLTGDHITHNLHIHLDFLLNTPGVHIAWNRSEKYGNLTVSEQQAIVALPTPYWNKFAGIKLPGERNARLYSQYFLEALAKSVPVRTKRAIEALCETCSANTTRYEQQIEQILRDELAASVSHEVTEE
jgi:hypothetical protein